MRTALIAFLLATQTPRDAPAPPAAGTAVIRGRVAVAGTSTPVARAIVTLSGVPGHPMPPRDVVSTVEGLFEFTGLAAGPYGISARPAPYQMQFLAGARTEVTAVDGQVTPDISLGLPRAGVIVGR